MSVRAATDGRLTLGLPRPLDVPRFATQHWGTTYDVSPDGERVYFPHPGHDLPPREVGIVFGWRELIR